jgi:hypothetical protein
MFREDGTVVHFKNPRQVQASIAANTYVISGLAENKNLQVQIHQRVCLL